MSNISGISLEMPQLGAVLFDSSRHMICVCQSGTIVGVNPVGERWMGSAAAALVGRPFSDLVHPDYHPGLTNGFDLLLGRRVSMTLQRPIGGGFDVEVEAVPLDDSATFVLLTIQDLDERVAAARELVTSEQLLRRLIDLSNDGVAVVTRQRVTFVNAAGLRMLGASDPTDVLGCTVGDLLHPSFHVLVADGLALVTEEAAPLPVKLRRRDGGTTDVELRVRRLGEDEPDTYVLNARDITQLRQSAESLREFHERLQSVLASVADGIMTVDGNGLVVSFNRAAEEIFGCTADHIKGKPLALLIPEAAAIKTGRVIDTFLARTRSRFLGPNRETVGRAIDGRPLSLEISCADLQQTDGRLLILAARDVSERKAAEEKIRHQATHDDLTGLPNRTLMFVKLDHVIGAIMRHRRKGALLLVDVDDFKLINDSLGHDVADQLLVEVAGRLRQVLRREDFLARFAGDQFVAIIPEMAAGYEAAITARRIIDMMAEAFVMGERRVMLTASVGIVSLPDDGEDVNEVLKNAGAALARAKDMARASMAFFTPDLDSATHDRVAIRSSLNGALDRDEFFLLYQPKIDLLTGHIAGVEALLRWNSPDYGVVSPVKFIPILEESNLIVPVGQWVLETACRQQKAWDDAGFHHIRTAVNLSVRQIRPGLVSMVEGVLAQTGLPSRGIEIEITESLVMRDPEEALAMLRALSELGIHLSIDDFGTGYSSLSYLRKLPLNTIKIDRSFVTDMASDEDDAEIVRTIIAMGHSLRRRIVAEGVETGTELALLREFNCDEVQGYLFSPPVPPERITELLRTEPFSNTDRME